MYSRIHLAGPDLTAAKMKPGALPSKPAGGQFSNAVLTPAAGYDKDGAPIIDATLGWWSTDTTGFDPATRAEGEGVYMYLDGAKRYVAGQLPEEQEGLLRQVAHHDGRSASPTDPASEPTCPTTRAPAARARAERHRRRPSFSAAESFVAHCEAGYPPRGRFAPESVSRLG